MKLRIRTAEELVKEIKRLKELEENTMRAKLISKERKALILASCYYQIMALDWALNPDEEDYEFEEEHWENLA